MDRYDREWGGGYGRDFGHRSGYGYPSYGDRWGGPTGRPGSEGHPGWGTALYGWSASPWGARGYQGGYQAGGYGGASPTYGGYPGSRERGMYYGGRGYATEYDRSGGRYGRGPGAWGGQGYGGDYARRPFVPEWAYREHPELDRPPHQQPAGRWPDRWSGDLGEALDDDEIRQRVEQNLHQDGWVDPERIQVAVDDGVVTLTGDVDDYLEARYAWDDAWETEGVRGVLNQLTVQIADAKPHGDEFPQDEGAAGGAGARGRKR
jgi:hypothetical protein